MFRPVEMAEKASVGGIISCSILLLLGILGCAFVSVGRRKPSSIASGNSDSFHAEEVRGSSRSRTGSLNSVRSVSHISSMSGSGASSSHPRSLASIISVVSRGTMTSENKGTMTESPFDVEKEVKKLKKAAEDELRTDQDANQMSQSTSSTTVTAPAPNNSTTYPFAGKKISNNSRFASLQNSYQNEAFGHVDFIDDFTPKKRSFVTQT